MRISLFTHLFYSDLWSQMQNHLLTFKKFIPEARFYFNLVEPQTVSLAEPIKKFFPNSTIILSENRGMDIGGKLRLINRWLSESFNDDYLIFCHDKKAVRATQGYAAQWRWDLLSLLDKDGITKSLNAFLNDSSIGMVGHQNWIKDELPEALGLGCILQRYAKQFSFREDLPIRFVGGTMFWVLASIFRDFFTKYSPLEILRALEVGSSTEPSNTHAFERIFGLIVSNSNHKIVGVDAISFKEDPTSPKSWKEESYLRLNPDVYHAVVLGVFRSGWEHYLKHGKQENRKY